MDYIKYLKRLIILVIIYVVNNYLVNIQVELTDIIHTIFLSFIGIVLSISGILCIINIMINIISDSITLYNKTKE